MGLSARYAWQVTFQARSRIQASRPALDPCLAKVWTSEPVTCRLRYRVTAPGRPPRLDLLGARCGSLPIEACVRTHLASAEFTVDPRLVDSIEFAGATEVEFELADLRGTGPAPPVERTE